MQVIEEQLGACRFVVWKLPDRGWDDVAGKVDLFLAEAVEAIAAELTREPVPWMVINGQLDTGCLMVFPSCHGPNAGDERPCFELSSEHLENEYRTVGSLPQERWGEAFATLNRKVWGRVGDFLRSGPVSRQLTEVRKVHPLRLAAFDYDFGEGLFQLVELDEEAATEMRGGDRGPPRQRARLE